MRNATVSVEVLRIYKRNALVRLRLNGALVRLDADQQAKDVNPRYFNGEVEFLVPRTSLSEETP